MLPLGFGDFDPFPLATANGFALLLGDCAKHFDQDIIDHLEYPFLPLRQFYQRSGKINHFQADVVIFEILQFVFDVGFISAQTVE